MERAIDRKPRNWIAARKLPLLTAYFRGPKLVPLPIWPPKPRSAFFLPTYVHNFACNGGVGRFLCESKAHNPFSCRSNGGIFSDSVTPRHHRRLKALNVISQLNYGEGISGPLHWRPNYRSVTLTLESEESRCVASLGGLSIKRSRLPMRWTDGREDLISTPGRPTDCHARLLCGLSGRSRSNTN